MGATQKKPRDKAEAAGETCPTFYEEQSCSTWGEMRGGNRFDNSSQLPPIKRNSVSVSVEIFSILPWCGCTVLG